MLLKAQMTSFTEMKNFWINIGMFSGATVYEMLAWHRIRLWHSGKINILSRNEQSPVLIRALPPDTSAAKSSSRNAPCCPVSTATTCSPGWVPSGPMVSGLAWLAPAVTHKKVNEKVGKIPWMGKEILVLQFGKTKKGAFIYGTLLSVPYPSHLVKGTRRQQWHFLVAKVLIKKMSVLPKDCCSF